jgi:hypothetical protein
MRPDLRVFRCYDVDCIHVPEDKDQRMQEILPNLKINMPPCKP